MAKKQTEKIDLEKKQEELDARKWYKSEIQREDLSGKLGYCIDCDYCDKYHLICKLPYKERVKINACAIAWKKSKGIE